MNTDLPVELFSLHCLHGQRIERCPSLCPALNQFLHGGLPYGAITEIGIPLGSEGRRILFSMLAPRTWQGDTVIWINSHEKFQVYPPSWFAQGFNPQQTVFVESQKPLQDIKQVLLRPYFRHLVFDAPGHRLTLDDGAYLRQMARKHRQLIIIIRPFLLRNEKGNPWVQSRLNMFKDHARRQWHIYRIKGPGPQCLRLAEELL